MQISFIFNRQMRLLFILLLSAPGFLFSQMRDKRSAPFTLRFNIGIPQGISSGKFRTSFKSVLEGNVSYNARLFSEFFVGVGYQYTNFQNNTNIFVESVTPLGYKITYNTHFVANSGFLKIGYDKFFEKGFATVSLNAGYSSCQYTKVVMDTTAANKPYGATSFNAPYLQPEFSVSFLADRSASFSLLLSYTTLFSRFDPKGPRFAGYEQIAAKSNNYFISWLNIGFGCTVLLGKR
jgi:hypothetical protein